MSGNARATVLTAVLHTARDRRAAAWRSRSPRALAWLVAWLLLAAPDPARAQELRMTCEHQGKAYWVSYDPRQRLFRTNLAEAGSRFRIKRDQVDGSGVLIWIGAQHIGGERDLLAFFGNDDKWVRHYYGNGTEAKHRCQ